jgi:hypothetical protein
MSATATFWWPTSDVSESGSVRHRSAALVLMREIMKSQVTQEEAPCAEVVERRPVEERRDIRSQVLSLFTPAARRLAR